MTRHRDVLSAIGHTPLIRLNRVSDATGCEIWGKAEFLNPGQSVKDRAALYIIRDAERKGLLRKGGTIVEAPPETPASGSRWSPTRSATRR